MSNVIIKGKIQNYERSEKYDDDGNKYIQYWMYVNGKKYLVNLPGDTDIYFEDHLDVVLQVDSNNTAVAGLAPKKGFKWGRTSSLSQQVSETDKFDFVEGTVIEKRKETFTINKGVTGSSMSSFRTSVSYTIVLPDKNFRVAEGTGKKVKPNTQIIAMLEDDVAYIIEDVTNNKIYGKARMDFLIGFLLLAVFNIGLLYLTVTDQKSIIPAFDRALLIGNIVLGIITLISIFTYFSSLKTLRIFKEYKSKR